MGNLSRSDIESVLRNVHSQYRAAVRRSKALRIKLVAPGKRARGSEQHYGASAISAAEDRENLQALLHPAIRWGISALYSVPFAYSQSRGGFGT